MRRRQAKRTRRRTSTALPSCGWQARHVSEDRATSAPVQSLCDGGPQKATDKLRTVAADFPIIVQSLVRR